MLRLVAASLCCAPLAAQGFSIPASLAPDSNDLNVSTPGVLAVADARVQQFYEAAEVGTSVLTARSLSLRYDGPGPAAPPGSSMTIGRLTVRVGTTALGVDRLGADLDANLSAPLTTAFTAQRLVLPCDMQQVPGVEPWGGPGGALRFPFAFPVALQVPTGGSLAVELLVEGNDNAGRQPAGLDFVFDASGVLAFGASSEHGRGCPSGPGGAGATLRTIGQYEPGTAFRLIGDGYPANAPVATLVTAHLLQNHFALPLTTPICWVYVDPATGPAIAGGVTGNDGLLEPTRTSPAIPLPKAPQMCGAILYLQNAAPAATFAGNQLGVVTSNYRTVVVGCSGPSQVRGWHAANTLSAQARIATVAAPGGIAMRIE